MNTAVAKVKPRSAVAVTQERVKDMKTAFTEALPAHIPADRFVKVAISALMTPDAARIAATPGGQKSIYDACMKAATDGLLLDGREAALVKFSVKAGNGWEDRAQYMPMVAGIMKKARNSGEIAAIFSQVVYANDDFTVDLVTDGVPITHRPCWGDRGEFVGVYAVARLKDGSWTQPEVMDRDQVEKIKKLSNTGKQNKGPWADHFDEMARKTVIRRASKYWPSSTDRDQALIDVTRRDEDYIEHDAPAEPQGRKIAIAAALLEANEPENDHDPDTGEVFDDAPQDAHFEEADV